LWRQPRMVWVSGWGVWQRRQTRWPTHHDSWVPPHLCSLPTFQLSRIYM
jgi:hypothetical protein